MHAAASAAAAGADVSERANEWAAEAQPAAQQSYLIRHPGLQELPFDRPTDVGVALQLGRAERLHMPELRCRSYCARLGVATPLRWVLSGRCDSFVTWDLPVDIPALSL